jgi:hypothetical protein
MLVWTGKRVCNWYVKVCRQDGGGRCDVEVGEEKKGKKEKKKGRRGA